MPDLVEPRLAALLTLSKAALGDLWKQFFGSTPPTQLRRDLMIPILSYRIQGAGVRIAQCPCSGTTSPSQSRIRKGK